MFDSFSTHKSIRREDSTFLPVTDGTILKKLSSRKIFAAAILATIAIVVTITALGSDVTQLDWDGAFQAGVMDGSAAVQNISDVWLIIDTVMSAPLITPAFAEIEITTPDQQVREGEQVTLTITGTGFGNNSTFTWYYFDDLDLGIDKYTSIDGQSITFTAPQVDEDVAVVFIVAVNNEYRSTQTNVELTILDSDTVADASPTAEAGRSQTVTKGETVTLSGASATDAEDDANSIDLVIAWTQSPDGTVTITDSGTLAPTIAVPANAAASAVTLTMTVTDSGSNTASDTRVLALNNPPQAEAGDDLPVTKGSSVSLSGASATDAEDDANSIGLVIAWTQSPDGTVIITNPGMLDPIIRVPTAVTVPSVTLTLSVTDSDGSTMTDTRVLTLQDAVANSLPQIEAGDPQTVTKGETVTLSGASATDAEDDANNIGLVIAWTQSPDGTVTITDSGTLAPTIAVPANAAASAVTLTMTVTDSDNNRVSDTKVLTINTRPEVDAGGPLGVTKGSFVDLLYSTATDVDNDRLDYTWSQVPDGTVTFNNENILHPRVTVASDAAVGSVALTLTVNDGTLDVENTMVLTLHDTAFNNPPKVEAGPYLKVAEGEFIVLTDATATDVDNDRLDYTWSQVPDGTVDFDNVHSLNPRITASSTVDADTPVTLTLSVDDGTNTAVRDAMTLTVINFVNTPPTVDAGLNVTVYEKSPAVLSGSATDVDAQDVLRYSWSQTSGFPQITLDITDSLILRLAAPGVAADTDFVFTLNVTDGKDFSIDTATVTVRDVPLSVSSVTYNPSGGQLKITFNQNIDSAAPDYSDIHIRSAGASSSGIALSDVTVKSYSGSMITATLSATQQEAYKEMQSPQLDITRGAVTDAEGVQIEDIQDIAIRTVSKKKSSSSAAPIVDLNTLAQARIVDIPSVILEQVSSHDASDPLESILHDGSFDFPLGINGYCYLLDDTTNTLTPQTVSTGQTTDIEFTVYTKKDLAHFTLYLNMQGNDVNYAGSDTYITYTNDGTVEVTDPHGYIADATITVTEEDDSMPERKTVSITIYFDEPMGSTNMVAYMWNTDRKATFVKIIDALEVIAAAETSENDASTDSSSNSADSDSEPDVSENDHNDDYVQSIIKSGIVVVGDDDDDAQTLSLIRMWSGFASESITDAELLESMGLDNYPVVHIPDWVMTELGALVSNNDVTVEEFRTALVYMLEMLTA